MRDNLAARAMVGVLLIAILLATLGSAATLAAGGGMLAAAAVYCLTGTALMAGWTGLVLLHDRWPPIRSVQVAVHGRPRPA
jgi:hypothetical protein